MGLWAGLQSSSTKPDILYDFFFSFLSYYFLFGFRVLSFWPDRILIMILSLCFIEMFFSLVLRSVWFVFVFLLSWQSARRAFNAISQLNIFRKSAFNHAQTWLDCHRMWATMDELSSAFECKRGKKARGEEEQWEDGMLHSLSLFYDNLWWQTTIVSLKVLIVLLLWYRDFALAALSPRVHNNTNLPSSSSVASFILFYAFASLSVLSCSFWTKDLHTTIHYDAPLTELILFLLSLFHCKHDCYVNFNIRRDILKFVSSAWVFFSESFFSKPGFVWLVNDHHDRLLLIILCYISYACQFTFKFFLIW